MDLFFQLLQVAIGQRVSLSITPTTREWYEIYDNSIKHALTGIAYAAISKLPNEQKPDLSLCWSWSKDAEQITKHCTKLQKRSNQLLKKLNKDGYEAQILKGLSLLTYYPKDIQNFRITGDIDVWITGYSNNSEKYGKELKIKNIIEYAQQTIPNQFLCYLHYDFPVFSDVPVELHLRASFLCRPIYNHRLNTWFESLKGIHADGIENHLPAVEQSILIILHIYKHLFEEGIGLRQFLDLYFVNKRITEHNETLKRTMILRHLGLKQFDKDTQYVMQHIFESSFDYSNHVDDGNKRGAFLLKEVLMAGNFGFYDPRIKQQTNAFSHSWEKLKHNFRLLRYYPVEVLSEPLFRLYHWVWRTFQLWRWE